MDRLELYEISGGEGTRLWDSSLAEIRRGLAEVIGTFTYVLVACLGKASPHTSDAEVAIAEGLTITAIVFAIGQVSGAHLNPATSVAFSLRFVFEWWRLIYYIPAQFIGAMLASLVVMGFLGTEGDVGTTVPKGMSTEAALGMEIIFTAITSFVYLNVAERAKVVGANGAIPVGIVVAALGIVGGPLGGASMNPFRSLAPAILARDKALREVWIFIIGPVVGSVLAVILTCLLGFHIHPQARIEATGIGRIGPGNEDEEEATKSAQR